MDYSFMKMDFFYLKLRRWQIALAEREDILRWKKTWRKE